MVFCSSSSLIPLLALTAAKMLFLDAIYLSGFVLPFLVLLILAHIVNAIQKFVCSNKYLGPGIIHTYRA